jgi:hypothetical protein
MSQKQLLPRRTFNMENLDISKRLSIRRVALMHGIPARVVARAVASGAMPALKTKTETGRDRVYISYDDALFWVTSLQCETSVAK